MKDLFINSIMKNISANCDYDERKLAIIRYGLVSLYLHITKLIVIFLIAYFLGTIKTLLLLMTFYSIIRLTGFGVHAKTSLHCWIASLAVFILLPFIIETIRISFSIKIVLSMMGLILLIIFAPADTEKRPLIHRNKRIMYKTITIIIAIIYTISLFLVKDELLSNCILFSILLEAVVVLPITYKLFGVKYNNYKNWKKEERSIINEISS